MQKLSFNALITSALYELYLSTVVDGIRYVPAKDLAQKIGDGANVGYLLVALSELADRGHITYNVSSSDKTSSITAGGVRAVEQGLAKPSSEYAVLRDDREGFSESNSVGVRAAPAADRVVPLDHNGGPVLEIVEAVKELGQKIRRGNDLGDLTAEEAEAAVAEVEQIEVAFNSNHIRPDATYKAAKRTLRWIGDKAAGAAVGKAAIALLVLIASFFGFSL